MTSETYINMPQKFQYFQFETQVAILHSNSFDFDGWKPVIVAETVELLFNIL
jgi:hypothetical protein